MSTDDMHIDAMSVPWLLADHQSRLNALEASATRLRTDIQDVRSEIKDTRLAITSVQTHLSKQDIMLDRNAQRLDDIGHANDAQTAHAREAVHEQREAKRTAIAGFRTVAGLIAGGLLWGVSSGWPLTVRTALVIACVAWTVLSLSHEMLRRKSSSP